MDFNELSHGKVTFNSFHIDFSVPFEEQEDNLSEDLLQVEYPDGYLIDLGWYPEMTAEGEAILKLIKDEDWLNPVYKQSFTTEEGMRKAFERALNILKEEEGRTS